MKILDEIISKSGLTTLLVNPRKPSRYKVKANLFVEVIRPGLFSMAARQIFIPNPEQWHHSWTRHLPGATVLAKTKRAESLFRALGAHVIYTGFTSFDRYDASIKRVREFLHVAGHSTGRHTKELVSLWHKHPEWPRLTVVYAFNATFMGAENLRILRGHIPDKDLKALQNACIFHVCPSKAEGFGHYIWEGLSCGATVLATDAAPMNEPIGGGIGIPIGCEPGGTLGLETTSRVTEASLKAAVMRSFGIKHDSRSIREHFVKLTMAAHYALVSKCR